MLPPKLAPIQVVMVPIYKGEDQLAEIRTRFGAIAEQLKARGISVKVDDRDNVRSGFKFAEYELKGVPVRLAMGPRDMENGTIELVRRDTLEKETVPQEGLVERIEGLMAEIQQNIFSKALAYRESMITRVDTWEEFKEVLDKKAVSCLRIGTGRSKPRWRSRMPRRLRSVASRSMRPMRRVNVSSRQAVAPPGALRPQLLGPDSDGRLRRVTGEWVPRQSVRPFLCLPPKRAGFRYFVGVPRVIL